jgi:hypothetical protein
VRNFALLCEHSRHAVVYGHESSGAIVRRPLDPEYVSAIRDCHPFVFSDEESVFDEMANKIVHGKIGPIEVDGIDTPFASFSIECLRGPLGRFTNPSGAQETWCVLVVETLPRRYQFLSLVRPASGGQWAVLATNGEECLLRHYLNRLRFEATGLEQTNQSITTGTGKTKSRHKIRRIVHVRPSAPPSLDGDGHGHIDWTHRFSVRGHWRVVSGLGKDRSGDYLVPGFTWVSEHIKGPEGLPFVKKTRFVERNAR